MDRWHDMAGWTPGPGRYMSIDDGEYGEYTALSIEDNPRALVHDWLNSYDVVEPDNPVTLTVVMYDYGIEDTYRINMTGEDTQ